MFNLFVLCIVAAISLRSVDLSSSETCAKGPSYWCASVQTANECHAFKHCLDSVWSQHVRYTKSAVDDQFLTLTNTPNQCANCIQCTLNSVSKCPYLHEFTIEVNQLIQCGVTPSSVCQLLGQCSKLAGHDDVTINEIQKASKAVNSKKDASTRSSSSNGDLYKKDILFTCGLHPRNWCDSLETASRCSAFNICMKGRWQQQSLDSQLDTSDQKTCAFCTYVFEQLQGMFSDGKEVNVKNYLMSACKLCPEKEAVDKCVASVSKFFEQINEMAAKNLDPKVICRAMSLCEEKPPKTQKEQEQIDEVKNIPKALKQIRITVKDAEGVEVRTPLQLVNGGSHLATKLEAKSMGVGCELCELVMNTAKFLLENKVDHHVIFSFVEKELCARLGHLNETCVMYVEEEGEMVLELLEKEVDAALVCRKMGLCLRVQVNEDESVQPIKIYDLDVRNEMNCTLCKLIVGQIKHMLEDQKSEQHILDYVNKRLCAHAGKQETACRSLVDAYGPVLLHIIAEDIRPDQVCDMIGMCQPKPKTKTSLPMSELTPATAVVEKKSEKAESSAECVLCEFAMSLITKELEKNATEAQIEHALAQLCQKTPAPLRKECSEFVKQYGPIIVNLLVNAADPEKICEMISLCPGQIQIVHHQKQQQPEVYNKFKNREYLLKMRKDEWTKKHKSDEIAQQLLNKKKSTRKSFFGDEESKELVNGIGNNTIECSLCIYAAELIDKALEQNKTEEQIVTELLLVCNLFPGDLKNQCSAFINEYGPYVIKLIAADLNPQEACAALKLCTKARYETRWSAIRTMLKKQANQ